MRTGLRSGASLQSGIVLDDFGCELSVEILPTVAWCLRGWEFENFLMSGISGFALHWVCHRRSLWLVLILACICQRRLFLSTSSSSSSNMEPRVGKGEIWFSKCERRARWLACVYVKGKERSPRIFSLFWNGSSSKPAWYKRKSFGIFSIGLEKGQAFWSRSVRDSAVLYEYE